MRRNKPTAAFRIPAARYKENKANHAGHSVYTLAYVCGVAKHFSSRLNISSGDDADGKKSVSRRRRRDGGVGAFLAERE